MRSQCFLYNWLISIDLGSEQKNIRNLRNRKRLLKANMPASFVFLIWFPTLSPYLFPDLVLKKKSASSLFNSSIILLSLILLDNLFYIKPLPLGLPLFIYPTLNLKNKEIRQPNRYLVLNPPDWACYCCTFDYKIIHYLARNQKPEVAPWCPCLCGHVRPLPIMSQSSGLGFGRTLLEREMRLQGLNIYVCTFFQHHFRKKQCWHILYGPFVLLQRGGHIFQANVIVVILSIRKPSEYIILLKYMTVLLQVTNTYICKFVYPHSEMYSDKHLRVQFSVIILCLFHILQRSWLQFQCTLWRLTWGYDLGSQNQDPPRAEYLTQIGKVHCLIMEKIGQMTHFSRTNYLYFYLLALLPTEKNA